MSVLLPAPLAVPLSGLSLVGFPKELPWQEKRPTWAIDATRDEQRDLLDWLAWFYGFPDPRHPPAAPLPPSYRFTAVGPTIKIKVCEGRAEFDPYPSSIVQFTSLEMLVDCLSQYRRQPLSILIDRGRGDAEWLEVHGWTRPEFVTLATTRSIEKDSRRRASTELWPGRRGNDEYGGQFGVIPIDVDFQDGDHAPGNDGLRLARRSEREGLFELSSLPWDYELASPGGAYRYLKLSHPFRFEEDPVTARELLQGAQRELIRAAASERIRVDLAFTGATSLCRVPFSIPTKYVSRLGATCRLGCPNIDAGPVVDIADIEKFRELGREPTTRRRQRAHQHRRQRHGEDVRGCPSACEI